MSARSIALAALREWRKRERFADVIIQEILGRESLGDSDRGFARELFYGVLRQLTLLDFWIGELRKGELDDESRDILRLGLYQLFVLRIPAHAAINETVELARKKQRALINGVMRSAQRDTQALFAAANAQPLAIRSSHPEFLIERWQKQFGKEATIALTGWNNIPPPVYGRINRLKIQPEEFLRAFPNTHSVSSDSDFIELAQIPADALASGFLYIQDPSTMVACAMLGAQPNEKILDACAAPGGKSAVIAQQMENRGSLIATDSQPERINRLRENLDRLGVQIANVMSQDWIEQIKESSFTKFDRVLVDAPCSNTGVMRRRVDVRWRLRADDFVRMQKLQLAITDNVIGLLKRDGVLVYSTCSLEPEENEQVVACLLQKHPGLKLTEQKFLMPFRDGIDGAFAAKFIRTK